MKVIVTGGAGYIGSHTVVELVNSGYKPIVIDNFLNSSPEVLSRLEVLCNFEIPFHEVDLTDFEATREIFETVEPEAVIHFASLKAVGESMDEPGRYYRNNLSSALSVLEAMNAVGCEIMVFSSSATGWIQLIVATP